MNRVCLIGRFTKKPELKEYGKGKDAGCLVRFTLAVTRDKDNTDWISCVAFGKTAELIDTYMEKGSQLGVEGSIQTGKYKDDNGDTHYTTDVIVNRIDFCSSSAPKDEDEEEEEEKPKKKTRR